MRIKFHIILYALLLIKVSVYSQVNTDSLIFLLQSKSGTEKVDLLNELSISYRTISLNESLNYADQAIELSAENDYFFWRREWIQE